MKEVINKSEIMFFKKKDRYIVKLLGFVICYKLHKLHSTGCKLYYRIHPSHLAKTSYSPSKGVIDIIKFCTTFEPKYTAKNSLDLINKLNNRIFIIIPTNLLVPCGGLRYR